MERLSQFNMYPPSNNAQNDRLGAVSDDKKQK